MKAPEGKTIRYPHENPPAEGEAIEVATGVLWMRFPLPMTLDHVNVFALDEGDGWTVVDTGFDSRRGRAIWEKAMKGALGGKPISRLIVTHHHPDHIGLAGWFQSEFGSELITTRTAWTTARMLQLDDQDRPTRETLAFWTDAGMDPGVLSQRTHERPFNFADVVAPMPLGYTRIQEGSRLQAGGRDWTVRIGNGHAPEHATLWSDAGDLVLGGDQLLPSISPNLGIYATEPLADPVAEWLESCARLAQYATDQQLVLPGHKLPFYGLPMRMDQLAENHTGALDRLRDHLKTPRSAGECFLPLFKREISGGAYGLALVEAMAHCIHLWHRDEVSRIRRQDGAWAFQLLE